MRTNKIPQLTATQVDRFWAKVKIQPSGCWEWQASLDGRGYGQWVQGNQSFRAHRLAHSLYYLTDLEGLVLRHICDNKLCVSPYHTIPGTHSDNARDAYDRGIRQKRDRSHILRQRASPKTNFGDNHHRSKLTGDNVREIRRRYAEGEAQRALATEFSISKGVINQVVQRDTWKHIE